MKKQYLVIEINDTSFTYIVDNLDSLISEIYEVELMNGETIEQVTYWFYMNYKVFVIEGTIIEKIG